MILQVEKQSTTQKHNKSRQNKMNSLIMNLVKKTSQMETINDIMALHYGGGASEAFNLTQKADEPLLTSTAGAANDVFGAEVWSQLNENANVFSILPKKPYRKAGFRIKTERGVTLGSGGVGENGAIPETRLPTYVEMAMTLKHQVTAYEESLLKDLRAAVENDDIGIDQLRADAQIDHIKDIAESLLGDVGTVAGNNFESIDRVCSSQGEESALLDAGDADIYGFDRSAATTFDAYVDHNSGTDRVLTKEMIRDAVRNIEKNCGERPNVILTGYDTKNDIDALFESQGRLSVERIRVGVNGVQTDAGNDTMIEATSVMGIPIVLDDQVVADTIDRIYFLNTKYLWFEVALPTRNFETGMDGDMILRNKLGVEGIFITSGELKCVKASAQGKIRDLK